MDQMANRIGALNTVTWLLFLGSLFMAQQNKSELNYSSLALIGGGFIFSILVNSKFMPSLILFAGRLLNSLSCASIMGLTIYMSRGESHSMLAEALMWLLLAGSSVNAISNSLVLLKMFTSSHKHA